jgi:hypothetical protein
MDQWLYLSALHTDTSCTSCPACFIPTLELLTAAGTDKKNKPRCKEQENVEILLAFLFGGLRGAML